MTIPFFWLLSLAFVRSTYVRVITYNRVFQLSCGLYFFHFGLNNSSLILINLKAISSNFITDPGRFVNIQKFGAFV